MPETNEKGMQALGHPPETAKKSVFIITTVIFLIWQKCFIWDKTCWKNTMGTFLRHFDASLVVLSIALVNYILQNHL